MSTKQDSQIQISIKPGVAAPKFELPDVNGNNVSLSLLLASGKKIVLMFYRGGWCPLCSEQLASLTQDYEKFKKKGAVIVAVSNEPLIKGKELLKTLKLPYLLLVDEKSKVIEKYGVKVIKRDSFDVRAIGGNYKNYPVPSVFIIGTDGKIIWRYIGKNHRDRPRNSDILASLPERR